MSHEIPSFETFCSDPQLINEPISPAWSTFYKIVDGLPLNREGVELYRQSTGRAEYNRRTYTEVAGICGRRSEKTSTALKYLIYKTLFSDWLKQVNSLSRSMRRLRIPLIAQDSRVSRDLKRTAEAFCLSSPIISKEIAEIRSTEIVFRNGIALTCLRRKHRVADSPALPRSSTN